MTILEKGTKVLIFNNIDQIDGNYIVGEIIESYIPYSRRNDKLISPEDVLYLAIDNENNLHKGYYDRHLMTPEDYKECLLAQIEDNNEQIKDLTEDNDRITKLISQIDKDMVKNQPNQRILKPKNK